MKIKDADCKTETAKLLKEIRRLKLEISNLNSIGNEKIQKL